ncbi:Aldehyde oxidase 2, partial [Operophtera brumata]
MLFQPPMRFTPCAQQNHHCGGWHLPYQSEAAKTVGQIMPRNQNALAIVNAAFNFELSCSSQIIEDARIVFGNISSTFVHATKTELFLIGKCVYDNTVLQEAVEVLRGELVPTENEEILATKIKFYGQPIAILVAISEELASSVAKKVK